MAVVNGDASACPTPPGEQSVNAHKTLPPPQNVRPEDELYFLNDRARVAEIDGIRGLMKFEQPGTISFRGGLPNPDSFPFAAITLHLKPPLDGSAPGQTSDVTIDGQDLDDALQYGPSPGMNSLRKWLGNFQETVHKRPQAEFQVSVGSGSQDLMVKCFNAVINHGDPILLEAPLYAGVLPSLRNLDAEMIEVEVDSEGLSAVNMESILSSWPAGKRKPKAVYTNPVGCNPSGCSASRQRKLDVLAVCKKHNILIIEDDPYYFLSTPFMPSYFELETQVFPKGGHVIRFDSVSKVLSGGMRLGFATGPKALCHAIDVAHSANNLHTSGIAQGVALALMKTWGLEGFIGHCKSVAAFYADRRGKFEALLHKHLDGLATWVSPTAGMFFWLDLSPSGIDDSMDLISRAALEKGFVAVPGYCFYPNKRTSPHVRLSFSIVDLDSEAELGLSRLAEAVRERRQQLGLA